MAISAENDGRGVGAAENDTLGPEVTGGGFEEDEVVAATTLVGTFAIVAAGN